MRTDEEIVEQTNDLAIKLYSKMGYKVTAKNFRMWKSEHPTELLCWKMACVAQEELTETDVEGNIDLDEY